MLLIVSNQTQTTLSNILIVISELLIAIEILDSHQRFLLMSTFKIH